MRGKKIGFIIDPVESFNTKSETTFFIMAEICRRGGKCFGIELKNLFAKNKNLCALATPLDVMTTNGLFSYSGGSPVTMHIHSLNALFLRKDPPVNLEFLDHLALLELAENKVFMINRPSGIRHLNEKLSILEFEKFIFPTLVSSNTKLLRDFVHEHKKVVLKPLNEAGGRGVILVKSGQKNLLEHLNMMTATESRYVMAQRFCPAVKQGDKRILLLGNRILGTFKRIPARGDFRGNLHSGAKLAKATLTSRDKKIVAAVLPRLKNYGQAFVGIDVIDGHLTEINVTSPMGIGELNSLYNKHVERDFVDWLTKNS